MNMRWAWTLPVLSSLATWVVAGPLWGQGAAPPMGGGMDPSGQAMMYPSAGGYPPAMMYPGGGMYPPAAMYSGGMQPAAYMAGPMPAGEGGMPPQMLPPTPTPDAYGGYGSMPMGPSGPGYGGPPMGGPGMYGGGMPMGMPGGMPGGMDGGMMSMGMDGGMGGGGMGGECPYCSGRGCDVCGGGPFAGTWLHNTLLGDVLGLVAPYPDGGCGAVRWYDFAVDYMMLKRDNTGRNVNITSLGIGPTDIVLSTNNLNFGSYKPGFRFTGALQVASANSLEFTYFGQFNYNSVATARSPGVNGLFSVLSNFGTQPAPAGFAETDQSDFQQIRYTSTFDSFEINWRKRWLAPNCRYQGSWTLGVRHFILDEKFRYATSSSLAGTLTGTGFVPAAFRLDVDTTNNLTGLQLGGDIWFCLMPGLRVGTELQAGVYGNHMNINNTAGSNIAPQQFTERLVSNDVSFIGQLNMLATYRINYQWTARAGYQLLFVDGVALASENFNTAPPALFTGVPRPTLANDNGNVFYHGWNVGLEFMW